MICNGQNLLNVAPFKNMQTEKKRYNGVSYGLSEAGYDIRIAETVTLHAFKRFSLSFAVEEFTVPNNLVGVVHDKSTWARKKLSVFNTVIEPGWCGFLTLELGYYGWLPLTIKEGSGVAQVLFSEISEPAEYTGKYQNAGAFAQGAISS